jgi:hypothetical protein
MYLVPPCSWWILLVCAFFTPVTTPVKKTVTYELLSSRSSPQMFALLSRLMAYNNISPGLYVRSALLRSSTILFYRGGGACSYPSICSWQSTRTVTYP